MSTAINPPPHDNRSSGLHSIPTASKEPHLNPWRLLQPLKRSQLKALWVPNGERAITRERVVQYQREQQ